MIGLFHVQNCYNAKSSYIFQHMGHACDMYGKLRRKKMHSMLATTTSKVSYRKCQTL